MNAVSVTWLAGTLCMLRNGPEQFLFHAERQKNGAWYLAHDGEIFILGAGLPVPKRSEGKRPSANALLCAPMPGLVLAVAVREGQRVKRGESLMTLEAMKMQNPIKAPADGRIQSVAVKPGMSVESGALLARMVAE